MSSFVDLFSIEWFICEEKFAKIEKIYIILLIYLESDKCFKLYIEKYVKKFFKEAYESRWFLSIILVAIFIRAGGG